MTTTVAFRNPPPPPPRPIPNIPMRYQSIRKELVACVKDGDEKAFMTILKSVPLTEEQTMTLIYYLHEEFQHHTYLHAAVMYDHIQLCRVLLQIGSDSAVDSSYLLARQKGGDLLSLLEPRLLGKVLSVGVCSLCEERSALYPLECGHIFCYQCSTKWAKECVNEQRTPKCLDQQCPAPIPINSLQQLLTRTDYESYLEKLLRATLSSTENFISCPFCPSGFIVTNEFNCNMVCRDCGQHWCPKCSLRPHSNISCTEALKFQTTEDEQNSVWKSKNSKRCPKCKIYIEKNSGCSHMTCKICQYQFCWICLGVYQEGRRTNDPNKCPCIK